MRFSKHGRPGHANTINSFRKPEANVYQQDR